jgi:HEAT repeat protein
MLENAEKSPLHNELFVAARWLRTSQRNQAWRTTVMRNLANLIFRDHEINALSTRAMISLAVSGDPGAPMLFRQFLRSKNRSLLKLSVLGLGLIGDPKSIAEITPLVEEDEKTVGKAVCMALVRIGNKKAVDALISMMLHGSEPVRIAAAESLAIHPTEGINILTEALETEDLLVRRAAIFGLMRINPPNLLEILESIAVKDGQWVVRNAAAQAIEIVKAASPFTPRTLSPSEDIPWLLAFAGKNGVGLANDQQAYDMVLNAVERGNETEQILALQFLIMRGTQTAASYVYSAFYGSQGELRDAAYNTLWHMTASGEKLPTPTQFGLG